MSAGGAREVISDYLDAHMDEIRLLADPDEDGGADVDDREQDTEKV